MAGTEQNSPTGANAPINYTYATFMETNGEEMESWYTFIRYQGNEEALSHLEKQLDQIRWYIVDDLSVFDLETEHLVSETTAKEMTKIDVNHYFFHRKFDGKLKMIDLGLKDRYKNEKKIVKVFDILGYGSIEDFLDGEDVDPEDLVVSGSDKGEDTEEEDSEEEDSEEEDSEEEDSESDEDSEDESEPEEKPKKKSGVLPKPVAPKKIEIPKQLRAKIKHRKNK
jgi:hypothetical protein